ncbi:HupE/UreJ family protein [Rhodopseudomonas sp.]|uniref:HupE/UreJ family protein n=1 Tax=Rhodopseudomonas sp. TaxID=1078 RepID=UPI003B39FFC3
MKKLFAGSSMVAVLALAPGLALAHPGLDHFHTVAGGVLHPLTGLDHVLAMVAVGLLAAQLGGRALWITPLGFVSMMLVGAMLGMAHITVPFAELGIALSVIVFGLILLLGIGLPTIGAAALVGFFAIFHGYAHGREIPAAAETVSYAAGFVLATGLLHGVGIALGLLAREATVSLRPRLFRAAGATVTVAGMALLAGAL